MNVLDIIIAIPLLYFIYRGWKRGLIFEASMLCGIAAGAYAAVHFSTWVAQILHLEGEAAILTAFFVTFVGVILLAVVLAKAVEGFVKIVKAGKANNILGAAFGMLKCLCVLSVLLNFVLIADNHAHFITPSVREGSVLFQPTYTVGTRLTAQLKTVVEQQRAKQ